VIEGCAIATVDRDRREFADGHLVLDDGRIAALGPGPAPASASASASADSAHRVDGRGLLATPALVNCHHHFYQSATRGLAQQATLFEWLEAL
jgi:cytosine/adenosine deaminase-related metal-dependent hydrolase